MVERPLLTEDSDKALLVVNSEIVAVVAVDDFETVVEEKLFFDRANTVNETTTTTVTTIRAIILRFFELRSPARSRTMSKNR